MTREQEFEAAVDLAQSLFNAEVEAYRTATSAFEAAHPEGNWDRDAFAPCNFPGYPQHSRSYIAAQVLLDCAREAHAAYLATPVTYDTGRPSKWST